MKANKYLRIIAPIFLLALILTSCDIDESINQSPNAINEKNVQSVEGVYGLTVALQACAGDFYSSDRSRITSIWTWQMCAPPGLGRPQPVGWNQYNMTNDGPGNDLWVFTGYRGVKIANDIIAFTPKVKFAEGDENVKIQNTILGMAKTYKAVLFGEMAALYGSIPIEIDGLNPPVFVTQKEAYDKVFQLLDEAEQHFSNAGAYERDLNFGGDGAAWTEVVNTLKARYHLHLGEYAEALAAAQNGISSADHSLFGIYTDNAGEYSPWGHWTHTEAGEPIRCEASFMRLLKSEPGDNRISEYFLPNEDGEYWGYAVRPQTQADADSNELDASKTCHLKKYGNYGDNFPIVTYWENVLIKAECEARTGDLQGALSDLNLVRQNAGLEDFDSSDKDAIISEVLKQKYLQLFLEGQAYHDMRRTGTLPDDAIPLRWPYPQDEINANPNVPDEGTDWGKNVDLVKWVVSSKYGGLIQN